MQDHDFDDVQLDSVFGDGPQVDLGDISDLIKDASIVDLSWLEEPITFRHSNSLVPANKELEHNWGDMTDSPFGAFKLVKGSPPVREQIKKLKMWDHSVEMGNNLYKWAPPSVSRVANKSNSFNSYQLLKRLAHRGYTGQNLKIEALKYMPLEEWDKAAAPREFIAREEGVLGNVYVDVTSFESCTKAKQVTDKYNKTANFVLKTSSCGDCSYNMSGKCSLLSKRIASREEIFSDENTKNYLDYLTSLAKIDSTFVSKVASLSNQEKLQKAFLARRSVAPRVAGVKAELPVAAQKENFNVDKYAKTVAAYLSKGYDADAVRNRVAQLIPHNYVEPVFSKAASLMASVPTDVARCDSEVLKTASSLKRTAKCAGCTYDMSSHCAINKSSFSERRAAPERKISATFASLPTLDLVSEQLIGKAARAFEKGHTYKGVVKAASKVTGSARAIKAVEQALTQVAAVSPDQFDDCTESAFKLTSQIKKASKCSDCSYNRGLSCGLTKRAFVQEAQPMDRNVTADHDLYGSFYKDLTLDRMVSINDSVAHKPIDIEELNQFNL